MNNLTYGQVVDSTGDDIYAYTDEATGKNMFKENEWLATMVRTLNKPGVGRKMKKSDKYPGCITIEMWSKGFVRVEQQDCSTFKAFCVCKGEGKKGYVDKCIRY